MALTWNGNFPQEVATTDIAAAAPAGSALQYKSDGTLTLATTAIDAYMVSEVVTAAEWNNRMYLYGALDWSAFTAVGEAVSIVKMKGCTAYGLVLVGSETLAVGDTLILDGTAGGKFKKGSTFASDPVIVLEAVASTATISGKVHIR